MKYKLLSEDSVSKYIDASDLDAAKEVAEEWMRGGEWGTDGATVTCTIYRLDPPRIAVANGDIEVHTADHGWGYISLDDDGTAQANWMHPGAKDLTELTGWTAPLSAMSALIAAVPPEATGAETEEETIEVDIEPDHSGKIADAMGGEQSCGDDPDDHDWTSDGEGGCKENPGVWSKGGTVMTFDSHCRRCVLHRHERTTGSQKNPGDHDTVTYEMLDEETIAAHRANGDMDEAEKATPDAE